MKCKVCGEDIIFYYEIPTKTYKVEDGKIIRDDAWAGPEYDSPSLIFRCSTDPEHDIDTLEINEWADKIETQFYEDFSALTGG